MSRLDEWGTSATRTRDGHVRVEFVDQRGRSVVAHVVITPDEWHTLAGSVWGDVDAAVDQVVEPALLALGSRRERYLVLDQYQLVPSTTPWLPDDRV